MEQFTNTEAANDAAPQVGTDADALAGALIALHAVARIDRQHRAHMDGRRATDEAMPADELTTARTRHSFEIVRAHLPELEANFESKAAHPWQRAQDEQNRAEVELTQLRPAVLSAYERGGLEAPDEQTAQLFARYLRANITSDRAGIEIDSFSPLHDLGEPDDQPTMPATSAFSAALEAEANDASLNWNEVTRMLTYLADFARAIANRDGVNFLSATHDANNTHDALLFARFALPYMEEEFDEEIADATAYNRKEIEEKGALRIRATA